MENHTKIFWVITFHKKYWLVQNHSIIRVYDGTGYLVSFGPEKYDAICNRIILFISQKSGVTCVISHN